MKKATILTLSLIWLASPVFSQAKVREKDLSQQHKDWLKLTAYVILPQEKEVFMQLDNDRDRDIFIESFWKQRDPTPGTPANEYKDEIIKRFEYANVEFRKGAPRDGWMTDMGRFYIILGPPNSKEDFDMQSEIYPCKVWYYYGDAAKGLPTYFALVFFKKSGAGEYKLYDPVADGPASLLVSKRRDIDLSDSYAVYEKIKETVPELAPLTLSMLPGDNPYSFESTLRSNFILQSIIESPKKDVNPSYARHFLNFRGIVSTEYLTNIVDSESTIAFLRDPLLGINFLHYSITPKSLSVDYFEPKEQYYCNYSVDVSLRKGEKIFYQDSKEFPFYFPPANAQTVRANGIAIQDSFPVIDGTYRLIILVKNSVGKEFSIVERDIAVESAASGPEIFGSVIGYRLEDATAAVHLPFRVLGKRLYVDSKNTFKAEDEISFLLSVLNVTRELWETGNVRIEIQGLSEKNASKKSLTVKLSDLSYNKDLTVSRSVSAAELAPDYYDMKFILVDGGGNPVDEKKANFIISPGQIPGRPISIVKMLPLANSYLYYYLLADQYEKTGDADRADAVYARALAAAPGYQEGIVQYSGFLVKSRKYERALELIEKIADAPKLAFDAYLIKGQALTGLEQYAKAIDQLLAANKIYDSDTRLLNALGFCFHKTGKKSEALKALNASLRLNPGQPEIRKLIETINKN
ncbi:MAG: GWxTD domain-containing protein [Acidobacteriota bacterium]|nr:GWxTD domain-containing protein [Acidobacteriota bacterium]